MTGSARLVTIKHIEIRDIDIIANLHKKNLVSPSSKIGKAYLKKLYAILLSDPKTHIFLVATDKSSTFSNRLRGFQKVLDKGKIVGAIAATRDLRKTNKLLGKLFSFSMLLSILKAIFWGKVTILELIKRFIFEYVSILIPFVDKKYQRFGIGRRLTDALLEKLKK